MYKGIYIALSGAILKHRNMDIFAQNIANANTTGYKKERISFKEYMIPVDNNPLSLPDGRSMTELSKAEIDFSKGTMTRSGNPLDLAIEGDGFFALEGNRYTRSGNFKVDGDGYLVTQDGLKVLGDGGPISVQGGKIDVSVSGEVFIDDISVGTIKLVDFPDKTVLDKLTGSIFATDQNGQQVTSRISQGYLEQSNVNAIQEMIGMIEAQREFESYQKMIQAFDEAASKVTNEMGR